MAHGRRTHLTTLTDTLVAIVAGRDVPAARLADLDPIETCLDARRHGILPLVAERLRGRADVPVALEDRLRAEASADVARDLACDAALRACLDALGASHLPVLLIKGAHLAYQHYARPDLRPRVDSDLLVAADARDRVTDRLGTLGYVQSVGVSGDFVSSQATLTSTRGGLRHTIDLHWRIANLQAVARFLSFEELARRSVAIPALGPYARGLSDADALVLACVHRVAHHYDSPRAIWLYDIHLLASRLSDDQWRDVLDLAAARDVSAECRLGLVKAREAFGTAIPDWVAAHPMMRHDTVGRLEALRSPARGRQLRIVVSDLRALPSWDARWRLVREHAFPPAPYMRTVYAPESRAPLAVLYARRAVIGARKWLGHAGSK